jgi:hypothetical protein
VVRSGPACRDQFVSKTPWEGQIGNRAVHVSKFASSNAELHTAKAVLADNHAIPR